MPISIRTLFSPSDTQIKSLFDLLGEIIDKKPTLAVAGISGKISSDDSKLGILIQENADLIKSASIDGQGFSINFTARALAQNDQGTLTPHPYYSTIIVSINDWQPEHANYGTPQPDTETALSCNVKIGIYLRDNNLDAGTLKNNKEILDPHIALISKIESSSANQISRINDYFVELTEKFDRRNIDLTNQVDARSAALAEQIESRRAELEKDYLSKKNGLEESQQELELTRKKLDDRTNTHARRAIRGELITTLQGRQDSFAISRDTKALRWPIHAVFMTILFTSCGGAAWSLYVWSISQVDTYSPQVVFGTLKTVIFTFTFITTAGLYVSWMNKWFDKHADVQFQTKQFEIDINRASWAVEAALEWKGAQNEQMPDVLLSGITKHLFEIHSAENTEYSPLEALATSILGSASNLNLDVNGNKMNFDRKSIKEIRKSEP